MSSTRKSTLSSMSFPSIGYGSKKHGSSLSPRSSYNIDTEKMYTAMSRGHSVYKITLMKKWDQQLKKLTLNMDTRQLCLSKAEVPSISAGTENSRTKNGNSTMTLDLRYVKEVMTLDFKLHHVGIQDKWVRDRELRVCTTPAHVLIIGHGHQFNLSYWILYFVESADAAALWCKGIHSLMMDTVTSPHSLVIERWMRKQYNAMVAYPNSEISMKHMKPFAQTTLQSKVQSKFLQELTKPNMNFEDFCHATRSLIAASDPIFSTFFWDYSEDCQMVSFADFRRFLKDLQADEMHTNSPRVIEHLRRFLNDPIHSKHHASEVSLTVMQFVDYLFSRENSLMDPMNDKVVHDMSRPLMHYWISSSHNTYLTGDQLRSESSLDSYARALQSGCRCIELDCWDGAKRGTSQEVIDIVIYHGYTMTSKLQLRDVLFTIKHYAFMTSEYPVILSIEDNCSVPAQRILAHDIKEILGDLLLTSPVNKDETQLPSPVALKRKIIIKHKKLAIESEGLAIASNDDFQDTDLLSRECVRRGILHLKNPTINEWTPHVFVLFLDRLCYITDPCSENELNGKAEDAVSVMGEEDQQDESLSGFGVRPEEMHVTEEWFHGKCDRQGAVTRLMEQKDKGNGVFLVRDSTIFIGDYSVSFLHGGSVHHCRIKTKMVEGEKKYYFLEPVEMDTLYELICYYMKHPLTTPNFHAHLVTACPQPQPHLTQPWFSATATKESAEELLSKVPEDGAFLIRYSGSDNNVFVISIRVDGDFWHYRLKRNGRIFVVNQTVFETLNQIVEYYSTRDFVRGISLKFPVNEKDVDQYAHFAGEATPGCYMDINNLDKEIQARALRPYRATTEEELSFPANAIITVLRREAQLWRGKYEGKVGWFPPAYVQEISCGSGDSKNEGTSYTTIELAGALVERATSSDASDRPHVLRISHAGQHWGGHQWHVSAQTVEEADDWQNQLHDLLRSANEKVSHIRLKEKTSRIASELSNLVVYCQAVPFDPGRVLNGSFYEMCSFSESKLEKLMERGLVLFNSRQLSRVYPQGSRITSANFNPVPMWNAGCHMVALNYQTPDRAMQLNHGKFLANGQCGYVLKPAYMLDDAFDPSQGTRVGLSVPISLTVRVIGGRHLSRKDKNRGICSPYVEVEMIGLPCDDRSSRTNSITSNGLNPCWNETFAFHVHCPEVALLRFAVEDGDFVGPKTDPFIGQAVFPLDCIRTGFRSVPLRNQYSEELELSSLLVHIEMAPLVGTERGPVIRSTHSVLQANRSVYAGRSLSMSATTPSFHSPMRKETSIDEKAFGSLNESIAGLQELVDEVADAIIRQLEDMENDAVVINDGVDWELAHDEDEIDDPDWDGFVHEGESPPRKEPKVEPEGSIIRFSKGSTASVERVQAAIDFYRSAEKGFRIPSCMSSKFSFIKDNNDLSKLRMFEAEGIRPLRNEGLAIIKFKLKKAVMQKFAQKISLHDSDLVSMAIAINEELPEHIVPGFCASSFWINKFKRSVGIVSRRVTVWIAKKSINKQAETEKLADQCVAKKQPPPHRVSSLDMPPTMEAPDMPGRERNLSVDEESRARKSSKGTKTVFKKIFSFGSGRKDSS